MRIFRKPRKTASRATIVNVVIISPKNAVGRVVPEPGKVAPKATLFPVAPHKRRVVTIIPDMLPMLATAAEKEPKDDHTAKTSKPKSVALAY